LASAPSTAPSATALPKLDTEWCTEGFDALDESTCYLVPDGAKRTLLIYLHGVLAPTGGTQRVVQGVVARAARKHGVVALMPRGRRGIGPAKTRDWYAWPTTADAYTRHTPMMIASWLAAKSPRSARIETKYAPFDEPARYVRSNGAYFVSILALRGDFAADGFGAMSGGMRGGRTKSALPAARPPFYVGYGLQDDAKDDPMSLASFLADAGWRTMARAHPVGHGARDVYLDEAIPFWDTP
jgi:hypothetical protein